MGKGLLLCILGYDSIPLFFLNVAFYSSRL